MNQRRSRLAMLITVAALGALGAGCAAPQPTEHVAADEELLNEPFSLVASDWGGYHAFHERLAGVRPSEGEATYAAVETDR
jgi:hypothetical protein